MSFSQFTEVASVFQSVHRTAFIRDRLHCLPSITTKIIQMAYRGLAASFLGMLILSCSACGGGSGGSSATPVQKGAPKPVQILAAGDSTIAGLIKNPDGTYAVTGAPTADLQADLQAALAPQQVTVLKHGVVGSTLPDLIAGTGTTTNFVQMLTTDTSHIVLENFGINDEVKETPDAFRQALEAFVDQVRQAGKIPVLEEPNPLCNPNVDPATNTEAIDASGRTIAAYVAMVDQVALEKGVALIPQYSLVKALPNWCALMSDGWGHPSVGLYKIKAQNVANVLLPIIRAMQ